MNVRQIMEEREEKLLSPYAARSVDAKRDVYESPDELRTAYQRDRDRILHCKSFRRLKDKTQVFLAAEGDHYRNRLTHTLEVSQISRTIAKALSLNEELTEAIALGHDLGHTPFGHTGEDALNAAVKKINPDGSFRHYEQSVRVVEVLENNGKGLNLTTQVRDGIRNHGTASHPSTLEGQIVRICDKIAYINHDIDDAIRADLLTEAMIPEKYTQVLGHSVHDRLNTLVHDVVRCSMDADCISQSEEVGEAMRGLRQFMFENVYFHPVVKKEAGKAADMVTMLFEWYMDHPERMTEEYLRLLVQGVPRYQVVCDYIAGMTDHYAITCFEELFVPEGWRY